MWRGIDFVRVLGRVVAVLMAGTGCSDGVNGECEFPTERCPCSRDEEPSFCCLRDFSGLYCSGGVNPIWARVDGCPCVPDPISQCGEAAAPKCRGSN